MTKYLCFLTLGMVGMITPSSDNSNAAAAASASEVQQNRDNENATVAVRSNTNLPGVERVFVPAIPTPSVVGSDRSNSIGSDAEHASQTSQTGAEVGDLLAGRIVTRDTMAERIADRAAIVDEITQGILDLNDENLLMMQSFLQDLRNNQRAQARLMAHQTAGRQ